MNFVKLQKIEIIHTSLVNGQREQMARQIDEYGLYEFFEDYKDFLNHEGGEFREKYNYFSDCVISYHRIKNR